MDVLTHWLAPAILAAAGAVLGLLFDVWERRIAAALCVIAGSLGAASSGIAAATRFGAGSFPASSISPTVGIIVGVFGILGAAAVAGGWRSVTAGDRGGRTSVLAGLAIAGAMLAITASDLVSLFAALEVMALSAYGLVALAGTDRAREASMKYFVQGAVATGFTLVAISILFVAGGGQLTYAAVLTVADGFPRGALLMAWALVTVGIAFKAGAFPFHSWAPDAYETAGSSSAGLLASVSKGAAVTVMAILVGSRVLSTGIGDMTAAGVVALIATGSIVFGNVAALRQRSFKRMLAYSGIAQVGYALIGVATGGVWSAVLLIMVYAPAALAAFLVAEAVEADRPDWDGTIAGMAGLARRRPALAAALAAIMLSLTGVPLLAGFWGKLAVFATAATGQWLWLAIVGAVGSVVSFGYYGAVLRTVYMTDSEEPAHAAGERRAEPAVVVACALAVVVVLAGVAPLVTGTAVVGIPLGG